MSSYLKKPPLRRTTKVVKGDPLSEGHVRETHVTRPLASNTDVPENNEELRRVEVPDDKVVAAKDKKKEHAAKLGLKKPPLKRTGASVSSKLHKRSKLSADDHVIDLDDMEGVERPEPIRSVHPKDFASGMSASLL
jgi:hypothetical protein